MGAEVDADEGGGGFVFEGCVDVGVVCVMILSFFFFFFSCILYIYFSGGVCIWNLGMGGA